MKTRCLLTFLVAIFFTPYVAAQETEEVDPHFSMPTITDQTPVVVEAQDTVVKKEKKVNVALMPVLSTNPTLGVAFGMSSGLAWYMGDKSNTSMSSVVPSLVYTTLGQFLFNFRGNVFLPGDQYNIMTDLRFQITNQPTYGLGTRRGKPDQIWNDPDHEHEFSEREYLHDHQMMHYDCVRAYATGLKRHEDTRFFYGAGYHLDVIYNINDRMLNLDTIPEQWTQHYRYNTLKGFSTKSNTVSGVSLNLMYDSRDNVANPYKGQYALATYRVNPSFLGSTKSSSTLWVEYRNYFNLSKERPRHLIAWWTYGWFVTSGNIPYMNLPATGWDMFSRSGRAYTSGRFRGEDLVYSEVEYRFPLLPHSDLLGGVLFTNAATASSRTENIGLFNHVNVAYGLGLRLMINKKSRSNVNFDYGWGTNGSRGFFMNLNETF